MRQAVKIAKGKIALGLRQENFMTHKEVNEWKEAVLDALALTHADADINAPPALILRDIINWHVDIGRFVNYTGGTV